MAWAYSLALEALKPNCWVLSREKRKKRKKILPLKISQNAPHQSRDDLHTFAIPKVILSLADLPPFVNRLPGSVVALNFTLGKHLRFIIFAGFRVCQPFGAFAVPQVCQDVFASWIAPMKKGNGFEPALLAGALAGVDLDFLTERPLDCFSVATFVREVFGRAAFKARPTVFVARGINPVG